MLPMTQIVHTAEAGAVPSLLLPYCYIISYTTYVLRRLDDTRIGECFEQAYECTRYNKQSADRLVFLECVVGCSDRLDDVSVAYYIHVL